MQGMDAVGACRHAQCLRRSSAAVLLDAHLWHETTVSVLLFWARMPVLALVVLARTH